MNRIVRFLLGSFVCAALVGPGAAAQGVAVAAAADSSDCRHAAGSDTLSADTVAVVLPWEQVVGGRIDSLLTSDLFRTTQVGLLVWDLTADTLLYAHNHQQRLRPASTMKLLTAITALDVLGGNHVFSTELLRRGRVVGRTLQGDLVVRGCMDPAFDMADLRVFVDRVRMAGIDTIAGRIVADRSWKEETLLGKGWCWEDDNPVLSPVLLARKDNLVERFESELASVGVVVGVTPADSLAPLAQPVAAQAAATAMPAAERAVLASCSHTIDQILTRMMKQSDNLYAEAVFYHLAAASGRPATAKNARAAVKRLISRLGFDASLFAVADGSGLSLYNYVSAELLVAFLRYAYRSDRISAHLRPTLPVAGADGTLKSRMQGTAAQYNVRAKTGTLTGVSSLAGYCRAPNDHQLCFAVINQGVVSTKSGKAFQDEVCRALCSPVVAETAP